MNLPIDTSRLTYWNVFHVYNIHLCVHDLFLNLIAYIYTG